LYDTPLAYQTLLLLTLRSNDNEQVFTWVTDDATLYFDSHETVRIRVEEETWHDQAPTKATGGENEQDDGEKDKHAPYGIIASMEESGLGPCLWWDGGEEEEEES
jgi:DNA-directed RNA polymerase III subunit RPC8